MGDSCKNAKPFVNLNILKPCAVFSATKRGRYMDRSVTGFHFVKGFLVDKFFKQSLCMLFLLLGNAIMVLT